MRAPAASSQTRLAVAEATALLSDLPGRARRRYEGKAGSFAGSGVAWDRAVLDLQRMLILGEVRLKHGLGRTLYELCCSRMGFPPSWPHLRPAARSAWRAAALLVRDEERQVRMTSLLLDLDRVAADALRELFPQSPAQDLRRWRPAVIRFAEAVLGGAPPSGATMYRAYFDDATAPTQAPLFWDGPARVVLAALGLGEGSRG